MPGRNFFLIIGLLLVGISRSVSAVVISEIHYHPAIGNDALEFVEITNNTGTAQDLSGYSFAEGIFYRFPQGTLLDRDERVVVCKNEAAVQAIYGIRNTLGDFTGQLDGNGERLTLVNQSGIVIHTLRYRDEGKWPVGPDGSGHSLVLRRLHADASEPESWSQSPELGGSPGLPNFGDETPTLFDETVLIDIADDWTFKKGTEPFSETPDAWRELDFDDSSWSTGPSGFGIGDGDDNTVLEDMRGSYASVAVRTSFSLTAELIEADVGLFLAINFDDGFCAFLNGVEIARANCPDVVAHDEVATALHEAREERVFRVEPGIARPGENVVAIVGFNDTIDGRDFSLIPRFVIREFFEDEKLASFPVRFNEVYRGTDAQTGWIELYNASNESAEIGEDRLVADPGQTTPFAFPTGTTIEPHGLVVVDAGELSFPLPNGEVRLFLLGVDGQVLTAHVFEAPPETATAPVSSALYPDGTDAEWVTETLTRGAPNVVSRVTDLVINEIFYHAPEDRNGEFIELYNRGQNVLDISGFQFTKGITHTFVEGATIAPDGYLVLTSVVNDREERGDIQNAAGEFVGRLANGGENVRLVDRLGNLVDEVRYWDGGRWSLWTDGRGASLELIDPRQDNDFASAWGASDESTKTEWEELSFTVPKYTPAQDSEFHMLLPERGECLVDDLAVTATVFGKSPVVDAGELWKYTPGTAPFSDPPLAWTQPEFDDSSWQVGPSGFGYGDDDDATALDDMRGLYTAIAIRKEFAVPRSFLDRPETIALVIDFDDGFCAFLNGVEIARKNCPNEITHESRATAAHEAGREEVFPIARELLLEDGNVLAILGANTTIFGDDLSLIPRVVQLLPAGRGFNHIPNSGFEIPGALNPWRIEGTHERSQRVTTDSFSGDACLQIVATGKGDSLCNRLELETSPRMEEGEYEVSFQAKWQRGSNLIIVHGDYTEGPWYGTRDNNMSRNGLGARLRMTVPLNLGTPGAENSLRTRLRAETGSDNLGPVIADVRHRPLSPLTGEKVRIEARVSDSDGLASVDVLFKRDTNDTFETLALFDDGLHGDEGANDGLFAGSLPGFSEKDRVVFYVSAVDTLGAEGKFPAMAPEKTCVYMVQEPFDEDLRIVLDTASEDRLHNRPLHSNALVDGAVTLATGELYYNVGVRYRGSPWGRPSLSGYRIRFNKDRPFQNRLTSINLTNHDRKDGGGYALIGRHATESRPVPVSDYRYMSSRINDQSLGRPGLFDPVGRDYLEKWYGSVATDDIVCVKGTGRHRGEDCNLNGWDEVTLLHMDDTSENYRFYWYHSIHQTRDNWQPLMELTKVMDPAHTSDEDFAREVHTVLDVESFLRVLGPRIMMGDWDALFIGNGHNGYMVWDPLDERWELLAFDFGAAFSASNPDLLDIRDTRVARLFSNPETLRIHYRLIEEFLDGYWSEDLGGDLMEAIGRNGGSGTSRQFLSENSANIRATLQPMTSVPFRITTNGGRNFESDGGAESTLEGQAATGIAELLFAINGGELSSIPIAWRSNNQEDNQENNQEAERPVNWTVRVPLPELDNQIEVFGVDGAAAVVASASIRITRSSSASFVRGDIRADGRLDLTDAISLVLHLFRGKPIACDDAADVNDNGELEVADVMMLLEYLFVTGTRPRAPFPDLGVDPSDDGLGCVGGRGQ
jgi:hypothetical protein